MPRHFRVRNTRRPVPGRCKSEAPTHGLSVDGISLQIPQLQVDDFQGGQAGVRPLQLHAALGQHAARPQPAQQTLLEASILLLLFLLLLLEGVTFFFHPGLPALPFVVALWLLLFAGLLLHSKGGH